MSHNHRERRTTISLLLSAVLLVATAVPVLAYHTEGPRWENTRTSGCCATIHVQYASAFYSGDRVAFDNGRAAWNNSVANILLPAASGALTVDDTDNSSVGWDGLTNYTWHACGTLLLSKCFTYAHVLLNYHFTVNDSAAVRQGIAAHELGHAVGLDHTNGCVLMTPSTPTRNSCGIHGPVTDDINGVNALY